MMAREIFISVQKFQKYRKTWYRIQKCVRICSLELLLFLETYEVDNDNTVKLGYNDFGYNEH